MPSPATLSSPTIMQVIPELDTGGAERTVVEVAEAIVRAGGRALVASEGGRLAGELAEVGGELIPFPARTKNPAQLLLNARRLATLIAARNVDLIHARSRAPAWSALLASRWTKRPFVTTYHGIYNQKSAPKAWYNGVMARGDIVIANSHYTASIVRERHGTPDERLHVIPRAVDLEKFSPGIVSQERIARLREGWGAPPDARIVLQAARLTRWKGQGVLIGAAGLLRDRPCFANTVIVLAGDDQGRGAYREMLSTRIAALGLEGKVILGGHCADMPAAFAAAWLTVIPPIEPEAFGRVSIEAQAMGCPVIVSDLGGVPETLPRSRAGAVLTGWLVEAGNEATLAGALQAGLELGNTDRAAIAAAARHHASGFSKAVLQEKTLQLYDHLLQSRLASAFTAAAQVGEYALSMPKSRM
jgi:glycosyltransferase involved in cell wall biosynthesis